MAKMRTRRRSLIKTRDPLFERGERACEPQDVGRELIELRAAHEGAALVDRVAGESIGDAQRSVALPAGEPAHGGADALSGDITEEARELFLKVGPQVPGEIWAEFAKAKVHPDLGQIHFIARAITPPRRPRRFDTRFLTADASAIAHTIEGVVGPDSELVELTWVPIEEATHLDMPTITGVVLEELLARVAAGMGHALPVPFYFMEDQKFRRELL